MQTKDIVARYYGATTLEEKVRRVRTPAGAKRFGQPIGSIIVRDLPLNNIRLLNPVYKDWDLVQDRRGKKYDVGKDDDGKWRAFGHGDWDDVVAEADNEDDLFAALDGKLGGDKAPAKRPVVKKRPASTRDSGSSASYDFLPDELKTPEAQAHFDRIWKGEASGESRDRVQRNLEEYRQRLQDFNAGKVTARSIIGSGHRNERTLAREFLDRSIAEYEETLRTNGRSSSVNQSNVGVHLRRAKPKGGESPDKPFGEYTAKMKGLWAKSPTARKNARMKAERSIDAKDRESLIDMSQGEADRYLELRAVGADHDTAKRLSKGSKRGEPVWGTPADGEASGGVSKRTSGGSGVQNEIDELQKRRDTLESIITSPTANYDAVRRAISEQKRVDRRIETLKKKQGSSGSSRGGGSNSGSGDNTGRATDESRTRIRDMEATLASIKQRREEVADEYRKAIRSARGAAQRAGLISERDRRLAELDRRIQKTLADIDEVSGSGRGN